MSKKPYEDKDVLPGEKLAVIEVLQNGSGAYQQNGTIRSEELGRAHFDLVKKEVSIEKKTRDLILPKKGHKVIVEAGSVMRRDARVEIFMVDGKKVYVPFAGNIHVSDADRDFSRDLGMAMRNGDIVKAEVINTKNRMFQLSIRGPENGVVYAYCSRCGSLLENQQGRLFCTKCNRAERRKVARNYGKEELV